MKILVKLFGLLILAINVHAQNVTDTFDYQEKTNYSDQLVNVQEIDSLKIFEKIVIDGYDSKIPFTIFKIRTIRMTGTSSFSMVWEAQRKIGSIPQCTICNGVKI